MASYVESQPLSTPKKANSFQQFNFRRDERYSPYSLSKPDRGYSQSPTPSHYSVGHYSAEKSKNDFKSSQTNFYKTETPRSSSNDYSSSLNYDSRYSTSHYRQDNREGKRQQYRGKRSRERSKRRYNSSRKQFHKFQNSNNDNHKFESYKENRQSHTTFRTPSKFENTLNNARERSTEGKFGNNKYPSSRYNHNLSSEPYARSPSQNKRTNSEEKIYDVTPKHENRTTQFISESTPNQSEHIKSSHTFSTKDATKRMIEDKCDLKDKADQILRHYKIPHKNTILAKVESSNQEPEKRPKLIVRIKTSPSALLAGSTPIQASAQSPNKIKKSRSEQKLSRISESSESSTKKRSIAITTAGSKTVVPYYVPIQSQPYSQPSSEMSNVHARPLPSICESKPRESLKRKNTGIMHSSSKKSKIMKLESDKENNLKFVIKLAKTKSSLTDKEKLMNKFQRYKARITSQGTGGSDKALSLDRQLSVLHRDHAMLKKSIRDCGKENWSQLSAAEVRQKKRDVLRKINFRK